MINLKKYYRLIDGKPHTIGATSAPSGFTEYDPNNKPQELIDALDTQEQARLAEEQARTTLEIRIPYNICSPLRGHADFDADVYALVQVASNMGATKKPDLVTDELIVYLYQAEYDNLSAANKAIVDQFLPSE